MQKCLFILLCLFALNANSFGKNGYHIKVKLANTTDTMAYLAHYYGKPLPTIYKNDSAYFDKNGVLNFVNNDSAIIGGIYMILLSDKKTYFEFLLNNGDDLSITADVKDLPYSLKFTNSPENEHFQEYINFLKEFGKKQEAYNSEIAKAKTKSDSTAVIKKYEPVGKSLITFRKDFASKYKGTLVAGIFNAMETPDVPEGKHLLPDGKVDSTFSYNYYKNHYWDKFDFSDDRLINTPLYDTKLDEYMNKLVLPIEDSVVKESDYLLAKARPGKEVFKYTLWWLTRNAETSKIMGMDAVFVYLVENYYMKGDATWLDNEQLKKYIDRAHDIAPNVIGNVAPDVKMPDLKGVEHSLLDVKAKYTLLVFWSPDCGHCQKEIPALDSVYNAVLKKKGVKVYAVRTEGDVKKWQEMIDKNKLDDWVNVYDPEHKSRYRADYDIYSTPVIYLLDEKKIIRGKRIDHTNIAMLIEMLEKKNASTKAK